MQQMQDGTIAEMPKYKCHKEVWALKISAIERSEGSPEQESDGSATLSFEDDGFAPIKVDWEYMCKHKPQAGGYYVVYADGYKSWSPAEAFEAGYSLIA